jgi:hypothetical protein
VWRCGRGGRVGEECAVGAFDYEDGEVRVGLSEFAREFVGDRIVDAVPEGVAAGCCWLDRRGGEVSVCFGKGLE